MDEPIAKSLKFLVDRCAGVRLARWLREQGFDVVDVCGPEPDPGDRAILQRASAEDRVLITIDADFGNLVFAAGEPHCGLVRLPDVPAQQRVQLMRQLLDRHGADLAAKAIVTVSEGRIRISRTR